MEDPKSQDTQSRLVEHKLNQLPPTPPATIRSRSTSESEDVSSFDASTVATEPADEDDIPVPPPTTIPTQILDIDKPTPDGWLPRDPRLIRLTGVHPFNVEAPLSDLYNQGFLTSPELFYVRNHGAVPQVRDDECLDWEFTVDGYVLVDRV